MSDWRNQMDDDELLDGLRSTFDSMVAVPESMTEMIMAGYDITNIDSYMADLVEDQGHRQSRPTATWNDDDRTSGSLRDTGHR